MVDNVIEKILKIKDRITNIKRKLREIPEQRNFTCTFEEIQLNPPTWIYKPRFKPKNESIPQELKQEFVQLIDDINLHLKKCSPDGFANLIKIIDLSGENKKSIIYLLENDVYNTDEVYGDYLVKELQNHYEINYHRWNEKKKQLPNQDLSIDLEKSVMNDVIHQIQSQFDRLWVVLENEINRCENYYLSQKSIENDDKINFIKKLLGTKECEFLDFKLAMYNIFPKNTPSGLEQRKEFLKDVLGLINNKRVENNDGKAYLLIGVSEENERYDGNHRNIDFTDNATLLRLINENIKPNLNVEIDDYYISGDNNNILIKSYKETGYERNIIIILSNDIGAVYEIKKRFGNPYLGVEYYYEGSSFTRDGSHTRRMIETDRVKIRNLLFSKKSEKLENQRKNKLNSYLKELRAIPKGKEGAHRYHILISNILLEVCKSSFKNMEMDKRSFEGMVFIDTIYTNSAQKGFFKDLPEKNKNINCNYILLETKNYSSELKNINFNHFTSRFTRNIGNFGILACRDLKNAFLTLKRCKNILHSVNQYLIILSDLDIIKLIELSRNGLEEEISNFFDNKFKTLII